MYKRFCEDSLGISRSLEATRHNQILNMKLVIIATLALVAAVVAAPPEYKTAEKVPQIVRSAFDQTPDGAYNFAFETDDGTSRNEDGVVKEVLDEDNKPQNVVVVRGSYTYINTDGKPETISYSADETGYHAEGDSIPKVAP